MLSRVWLCGPMDCSPPGSSVHEIRQAGILEWVAMPFSKWSPQPRDWTLVSCIAGRFFAIWATRESFFAMEMWTKNVACRFSKQRMVQPWVTAATPCSAPWGDSWQKNRILTLDSYSACPRNNHKPRLLHLPIHRKALKLTWDVWLLLWLEVIFWCLTTWFRFWLLFFSPQQKLLYTLALPYLFGTIPQSSLRDAILSYHLH